MTKIKWGIIGCGDVAEVKSGPAFQNVADSELVAVMRRDGLKAEDYARRHGVPKWYTRVEDVLNDAGVNAIYIASPPASHAEYALAALRAGKPVYLEKPMTLNAAEAREVCSVAREKDVKLVVAHYRRAQPYFNRIKELLEENSIGKLLFARLSYFDKPLTVEKLQSPRTAWRVDPAVSGGGLFHDLAPHQLDLACYFFGAVQSAQGFAGNQGRLYEADDIVSGTILFESGVIFEGLWNFNVPEDQMKDCFEIYGSRGKISFAVFGKQEIRIEKDGVAGVIPFEAPAHVQQPMIEQVVQFFLDRGPNPCPAERGVEVMELMDKMTGSRL